MKFCEFCGRDISHHGSKKIRYCQPGDGDNGCSARRQTEIHRKSALKKAKGANRLCIICGKLVNSGKATTCSYSCSAKLREGRANKHYKPTYLTGSLEWPYKLPVDPHVTPSMMCPLG